MPAPLSRRTLSLAGLSLLGACRRVPRCSTCGMALDPSSRWYAEVEAAGATEGFDTPKCALRRLLQRPGGKLWVRGYYRQQRVSGDQVVFAAGSDVLGPMGADLVPVEPEHEEKYRAEHRAQTMYRLGQLTLAIVEAT